MYLVETSRVVLCVHRQLGQSSTAGLRSSCPLFWTSFNCPLGHMRIGLVSCPFFIFMSSRTPGAQLWYLSREATRHLLLYSSRLSLFIYISQRVFAWGIWTRRACSRMLLSILDNSLCSVSELVFEIGDVGQPLGHYYCATRPDFGLPAKDMCMSRRHRLLFVDMVRLRPLSNVRCGLVALMEKQKKSKESKKSQRRNELQFAFAGGVGSKLNAWPCFRDACRAYVHELTLWAAVCGRCRPTDGART